MAVRMRLRRMGRKKRPMYRVVVAESRFPRDGRFIESLGYYNPMSNPADINLKEDRVMYWLSNGAQPTDTVKNILQDQGIWLKFDLEKKKTAPEVVEAEFKKWKEGRELKAKRKELAEAQKAEAAKKAAAKAVKEEKKVEEKKEEEKPAEDAAAQNETEEKTDA